MRKATLPPWELVLLAVGLRAPRRTLSRMAILPRRRAAEPSKEQALADARKATARLRRSILKARRHQSGKQDNPVEETTPNQWLGGSVH
jgi:hypothetical protein